jgi:hypothetical protein
VCRDAWQNDNNRNNARYHYAQECPHGEYFLVFCPKTGGTNENPIPKYRIQLSTEGVETSINYNGIVRTSIAIHNGGSKASIGCITYNLAYSPHGNIEFIERVYGVNETSLSNPNTTVNRKRICLICIDERNAVQPTAGRLYYDLVNSNGVQTP